MADKTEKVLAKGIYVEKPSVNAPTWVIAKVSFKVADAMAFLEEHVNNAGYVNLDVLISKDGQKYYAALNQFVPEKPGVVKEEADNVPIEYPPEDINPDDIPF